MDGNGRWAEQKGMPRIFGHQNGVTAVRRIVESASKFNIKIEISLNLLIGIPFNCINFAIKGSYKLLLQGPLQWSI